MYVSHLANINEKKGLSMNDYLENGKQILDGFTRKFVGINIVSSNPERLINFYREVLRAYIVNDKEHAVRTVLKYGLVKEMKMPLG